MTEVTTTATTMTTTTTTGDAILLGMPIHVQGLLLSFLDIGSLEELFLLSRAWHRYLYHEQALWRAICLMHYATEEGYVPDALVPTGAVDDNCFLPVTSHGSHGGGHGAPGDAKLRDGETWRERFYYSTFFTFNCNL
eukprot:TRINITY_DN4173_c0_g5_i1.p2 TRINITY_DN4173_c0_g5~~TRINITY_DN4173_c0_g5_i1.p2  ORF type:complete len:137 (+),score=29.21 TRINITY_DN4173_c0_g5_i1:36-446(+)